LDLLEFGSLLTGRRSASPTVITTWSTEWKGSSPYLCFPKQEKHWET